MSEQGTQDGGEGRELFSDQSQPPVIEPPVESFADVSPPGKPRIWPTFLMMLAAPGVGLLLMLFAMIPIGIFLAIKEGDIAVLEDEDAWDALFMDPVWELVISGVFFGGLLAAALAAAFFSPRPLHLRLGLIRPNCSWWMVIPFVGSAIFVGYVEVFIVSAMFDEPSEALEQQYELISQYAGTMIVLGIISFGLIPGFIEEILCRGYIQLRLTRRFGPLLGILIASAYFGLLHFDVQHSIATFIGGIWFGIIVWRTNSIWLAIICHALYNMYVVGIGLWIGPEAIHDVDSLPDGFDAVNTAIFLVTGVLFLWSIIHLARHGRTEADPEIG